MKKRVNNLLIIFCISSFSFAATPSFQGLGDLPGNSFFSVATDISGDGTVVVGYSDSISGSSQVFRWTAETGMVGLDGFVGSYPMGSPPKISRDGSTIVGSVQNEAARWTSQYGLERLGILGGIFEYYSKGTGVSADGSVVVGYSTNSHGNIEAFKWTPQTSLVGLGSPLPGSRAFAVSDSGSVTVGTAYYVGQDGLEGVIAARWTEDGMTYFDPEPDFIAVDAAGISADGSVIVGSGMGSSNSWEAYRWTAENGIVPLGFIREDGYNSYAWGVSGDGSKLVGDCSSFTYGREAFVWDEENGMRSIKEILVTNYGLNLSGWSLTMANAISYDGMTIIGVGENPDGNLEGWIATIPEPASLLLLGLGGLLIRKK